MCAKRITNLVFVISLVMALGFAVTPALAEEPETFIWEDDFTYKVDNPCHLKIVSHTFGYTESKVWFEENGELIKAVQLYHWTEIWSAGGNSLEFTTIDPAKAWVEKSDEGYYAIFGTWYKVVLPGEGVVVKDIGQWTRNLTYENGEFITTDLVKDVGVSEDFNWTPVCKYLGP